MGEIPSISETPERFYELLAEVVNGAGGSLDAVEEALCDAIGELSAGWRIGRPEVRGTESVEVARHLRCVKDITERRSVVIDIHLTKIHRDLGVQVQEGVYLKPPYSAWPRRESYAQHGPLVGILACYPVGYLAAKIAEVVAHASEGVRFYAALIAGGLCVLIGCMAPTWIADYAKNAIAEPSGEADLNARRRIILESLKGVVMEVIHGKGRR